MAKKLKKTKMAGGGCFVQGIGLLLLPVFPVGTVIGLGLMVWGSLLSVYYVCGACANPLPDKNSKVCPVCKAELE